MQIENCRLCPRQCNATRTGEEGNGFCRMPADPVLARVGVHQWEEPCISGTRGSGTVFFSGCTLRCLFCQNYTISTDGFGRRISINQLVDCFRDLEEQHVHNINLVNPVHFMPAVRAALQKKPPHIPVVWNSGGYERVETLCAMDGLVHIYLPDLKYKSSEASLRYSGAEDYFTYVSKAILEMVRQIGECQFDADGIMQKGVMIRHLILPGHTNDSIQVLEWIASYLPKWVCVSLMAQYVPMGKAQQYPEINRRITKREYEKVLDKLFALGLENGYVQERKAANIKFTPAFDLSGVPEAEDTLI